MAQQKNGGTANGQTSSSPSRGTILSSKSEGIGSLIFDNVAKHNAVSLDMWNETARVLERFAADPDVRVVVIAGAGGKAFVSAADISRFESERASQERDPRL